MIQVVCYNCEQLYSLRDSKYKDEREQIIRYAKCPFCGTPRDAQQFSKKETHDHVLDVPKRIEGQCDVCGATVTNKKYNLCRNCYSRMWKQETNYNRVYMKKWREKNHYKNY